MSKTSGTIITGVKAIFFDLDDTLFDRRSAQRQILHLVIGEFHGLLGQIEEDVIVNAFLDSDAESVREFNSGASIEATRLSRSRRFLSVLGLDAAYADAITASYLKHYPSVQTPVDGAPQLITQLAPVFQLGVISNGSPDVQRQKLDRLGLNRLINCVIISEEVGVRKPDPAIFWKAADSLGRKPEECLHVGDTHDTDVIGAKRAGLKACWFNRYGLKLGAHDVRPDIEIGALSDLVTMLDTTPC